MSTPPFSSGRFPRTRMRRNRRHPWSRKLVAENVLTAGDLLWPVFITEGKGERQPIVDQRDYVLVNIIGIDFIAVRLCRW